MHSACFKFVCLTLYFSINLKCCQTPKYIIFFNAFRMSAFILLLYFLYLQVQACFTMLQHLLPNFQDELAAAHAIFLDLTRNNENLLLDLLKILPTPTLQAALAAISLDCMTLKLRLLSLLNNLYYLHK